MEHKINERIEHIQQNGRDGNSFEPGTFSETVDMFREYGIFGRNPGSSLHQHIMEAEKIRRKNRRVHELRRNKKRER